MTSTWPTGIIVLLLALLWVECRLLSGRPTVAPGRFFLAFCFGTIGATVLSLLLERVGDAFITPAHVGYTLGPPVEELAKALPLILIAFVWRDGRRLGIADLTLLGVATGLGFEFVETNLRALASGSLANGLSDVTPLIPGWRGGPGGSVWSAGHAVWTGLVGLACGVGLRLWPRGRWAWLPAVPALFVVTLDHALFNYDVPR